MDSWLNRLRRVHAHRWEGRGRPPDGAARRKFAAVIVKLDRIGDFVLALSAIRRVVRRFGEENCALVISPWAEDLARGEFPAAERIVLPAFAGHKRAWIDWRRARAVLAGVACDHLVCLRHQRSDYDELILTWIEAGRVHAVADDAAQAWMRNQRVLRSRFPAPYRPSDPLDPRLCRELDLHGQVLASVLGERPAAGDLLPAFARAGANPGRAAVIVAPFASDPLRDLPPRLLLELGARAEIRPNPRVLLVGSPAQRDRLTALAANLRATWGGGLEVETPPEIGGFVASIASADWVLTADSAAAHIATALDRPTVVLLGGGHYGHFAPWRRSDRQCWLSRSLPCFHCGWNCLYAEPRCLTEVTVDEATEAIRQVTGRRGDQPA